MIWFDYHQVIIFCTVPRWNHFFFFSFYCFVHDFRILCRMGRNTRPHHPPGRPMHWRSDPRHRQSPAAEGTDFCQRPDGSGGHRESHPDRCPVPVVRILELVCILSTGVTRRVALTNSSYLDCVFVFHRQLFCCTFTMSVFKWWCYAQRHLADILATT